MWGLHIDCNISAVGYIYICNIAGIFVQVDMPIIRNVNIVVLLVSLLITFSLNEVYLLT